MKKRSKHIVKAAIIAAIYICMGLVFGSWGFHAIQLRPAEALNVLINYTSCAPWGLFVGCVVANFTSPYGLLDIICGSVATLTSALIGRCIKNKYLALLPSVLINAVVVSAVICYSSNIWDIYLLTMLEIGLSQAVSVYLIGIPLMFMINHSKGLKRLLED